MTAPDSKHALGRRILLRLILLLGVFLLGFVPQYRAASEARRQLADARTKLAEVERRMDLAQLRDLIALVYLEVSQKNYGLAAQRSTAFFDRVAKLAASHSEPESSSALKQILAARDGVTAALAAGDPAVTSEIQRLFKAVFKVTGG